MDDNKINSVNIGWRGVFAGLLVIYNDGREWAC